MTLRLNRFYSRHFRNLEPDAFVLHPRFNLFFGDNGQGKTNLLEAIYYLFTLRPLRSLRARDLIAWGEQKAEVHGEVEGRVKRRLRVKFNKNKRQILLNGAPPVRLDDYFDGTHIVAFTPEEIQLVRGAPDLRRRFLDRAVFNTDIGYLKEVRLFLRVLSHRNALLKKDRPDPALLEVLDEQFILHSARIVRRRMQTLERLRQHMRPAFQRIFPDSDLVVDLSYQSKLGRFEELEASLPAEELEELVMERTFQQLKRTRQRELDRRTSLVGPHLDDIAFTFQGRPFKHAASQGQTRALVLALKIAEILEIESRTGQHPLLLLDDVAGELDPRHSACFFSFLEETQGQVLLSTTSLDYIQLPDVERYPCFRLEHGHLHAASARAVVLTSDDTHQVVGQSAELAQAPTAASVTPPPHTANSTKESAIEPIHPPQEQDAAQRNT